MRETDVKGGRGITQAWQISFVEADDWGFEGDAWKNDVDWNKGKMRLADNVLGGAWTQTSAVAATQPGAPAPPLTSSLAVASVLWLLPLRLPVLPLAPVQLTF